MVRVINDVLHVLYLSYLPDRITVLAFSKQAASEGFSRIFNEPENHDCDNTFRFAKTVLLFTRAYLNQLKAL
jgi:hypothetical protein